MAAWPGCELNHSFPSRRVAKNAWSYTSVPFFMVFYWAKQKETLPVISTGKFCVAVSEKLRWQHCIAIWLLHRSQCPEQSIFLPGNWAEWRNLVGILDMWLPKCAICVLTELLEFERCLCLLARASFVSDVTSRQRKETNHCTVLAWTQMGLYFGAWEAESERWKWKLWGFPSCHPFRQARYSVAYHRRHRGVCERVNSSSCCYGNHRFVYILSKCHEIFLYTPRSEGTVPSLCNIIWKGSFSDVLSTLASDSNRHLTCN
jgi:hypothetical protein